MLLIWKNKQKQKNTINIAAQIGKSTSIYDYYQHNNYRTLVNITGNHLTN